MGSSGVIYLWRVRQAGCLQQLGRRRLLDPAGIQPIASFYDTGASGSNAYVSAASEATNVGNTPVRYNTVHLGPLLR